MIARAHVLPAPRASRHMYARAVRELVAAQAIDVIVPTCEEIFHLAAIRDNLGARVMCEPLDRLAPLHDKWRFIAACEAASLKTPRTVLLSSETGVERITPGAYILKPRYSRFATRVAEWQSGSQFPAGVDAQSGTWIAQERISGVSLCTWSVAARGRVTAHATYAVDATAGAMGAAISFHSVRHAGALAWVRRFVGHHGLTGQFAFDFIEHGDGVVAIECNPRLTSGVHCFRAQPDVVHSLLDPDATRGADVLEPEPGLHFRSRLALLMYPQPSNAGGSLLAAADDPWPRRLQALTWTHMLMSSLLTATEPRRWSTRDIEWNNE
jgi:ATP-grasp domain